MTIAAHDADDPMRHSGARWCTEHHRWECAAKVSREHHASAMRGQAYCKHHVGKSTALAKLLGEGNLAAWRSQDAAAGVRLDPSSTVLDQLRVAVMRADGYGELLRLQWEDEGFSGLVGSTFAAGRDGARVEVGEGIRALAKLESAERDRVVRVAKVAHDMGIDERNIEIEQVKAQRIVASFVGSLEALMEFIPVERRTDARDAAMGRFLEGIGRGDAGGSTVAGELG